MPQFGQRVQKMDSERLSSCKYKVLHLAQSNQLHKHKIESKWLCSSSGERTGSYGRSQSRYG